MLIRYVRSGLNATVLALLMHPLLATGLEGQGAVATAEADLPVVAVLDFEGIMMDEAGNSPFIGKAVSSMLITELSGREGMRIIERFRLQELLTEQRLVLSGRTAEGALEIGRMLGAQYMITGQSSASGNEFRIDMRVFDVETTEILEVQKLSGEPRDLMSLVVRIADIFAARLALDAPSARPALEEIPVRATIEFSRAVDFEDRGDTARAIQHYRSALEIHPNHQHARAALERLERGGSDR